VLEPQGRSTVGMLVEQAGLPADTGHARALHRVQHIPVPASTQPAKLAGLEQGRVQPRRRHGQASAEWKERARP
jgi:hypothetical protein